MFVTVTKSIIICAKRIQLAASFEQAKEAWDQLIFERFLIQAPKGRN
jgi:hypothetical protein